MGISLPTISELRAQGDTFGRILECPALYGVAGDYLSLKTYFDDLLRHENEGSFSNEIRLALIYAEKNRSDTDVHRSMQIIERLRGVEVAPRIRYMAEVVRAALLVFRMAKYAEGLEAFSAVHRKLRESEEHFLYGLCARNLGVVHMYLGNHSESESAYHDALAIFRRYNYPIMYAFASNDLAVLKKKTCHYDEADRLLRQAIAVYERSDLVWGRIVANVNAGFVNMKRGNWRASVKRCVKTHQATSFRTSSLTSFPSANCASA